MTYLNVDEVETAIALAADPSNAGFTELVTLPNQTWEGRTCHAVRIHHGAAARSGVYLLGGIHAREWGSPDILVNFVQLLTDAYRKYRECSHHRTIAGLTAVVPASEFTAERAAVTAIWQQTMEV